ncbi:MAG TPA: M56 family metallopeptidase, partial [Bryobacteraceae bacterium]|nr:M56 family metallopeptidase [Bryobacteraceae bacterium]
VETVFWFHPFVWWIGKRMVCERERACDEEVLECGNSADSYAEAILQVCRFCLESPLPCASSITGSDLRHRIAAILSPRVIYRLHPIKKFMLAGLALAAVTGPLAIGVFHPPGACAQQAARMSFDVASVKPFQGRPTSYDRSRSGGRIRWTTTLMGIVMYAYRIEAFQETGMSHVPYTFYTIDAETNASATDDQIRLMFQSLLADRFRFVSHRETRQLPGYALVPAKGGPKIKPFSPEDPPAPLPPWLAARGEAESQAIEGRILATTEGIGVTAITARRITMAQLVQSLEDQLRAAVTDQSGLSGQYYFAFKCVDVGATDADPNVPTLFDAVQESLGLRLEKRTVPVEMLVVDHIESTPTEN